MTASVLIVFAMDRLATMTTHSVFPLKVPGKSPHCIYRSLVGSNVGFGRLLSCHIIEQSRQVFHRVKHGLCEDFLAEVLVN